MALAWRARGALVITVWISYACLCTAMVDDDGDTPMLDLSMDKCGDARGCGDCIKLRQCDYDLKTDSCVLLKPRQDSSAFVGSLVRYSRRLVTSWDDICEYARTKYEGESREKSREKRKRDDYDGDERNKRARVEESPFGGSAGFFFDRTGSESQARPGRHDITSDRDRYKIVTDTAVQMLGADKTKMRPWSFGFGKPLIPHYGSTLNPGCFTDKHPGKFGQKANTIACDAADAEWVNISTFRIVRKEVLDFIMATHNKGMERTECSQLLSVLGADSDACIPRGRSRKTMSRVPSNVLVFGHEDDPIDRSQPERVQESQLAKLIDDNRDAFSADLTDPRSVRMEVSKEAKLGRVTVMTKGVLMDAISDGAVHWITYVFNPHSHPPTLYEFDPGTGVDEENTMDGFRVDDDLVNAIMAGIKDAGYNDAQFVPSALSECPQRWQRDGFCQTWSMFLLWAITHGINVNQFPFQNFGTSGLKVWLLLTLMQVKWTPHDTMLNYVLAEFTQARALFWHQFGETYEEDPDTGEWFSNDGMYFNIMHIVFADPSQSSIKDQVDAMGSQGSPTYSSGSPISWARNNVNYIQAFENLRRFREELGLGSW